MKQVILAGLAALVLLPSGLSAVHAEENAQFDAALAAELGADDYGMRRYVMAFLRAGPERSRDPETAAAVQRGHLDHIRQMAEDGKLVVAGPFLDGGELRGIFIFAVDTIDEAEALTAADPAVQAGVLAMELKPWYGSAALLKLGEIHTSIARTNP